MTNWDDLRLFLAVARFRTLTAAAAELGCSVSTLHRHLAAFETNVGAKLFEKGPRGYQLTHVGEALLPRAEEAEEAVFGATRAVVGHDQQASGDVRITLPPILMRALARHLAAFSQVSGRIRLVIQADDVLMNLERDTDLALRATTQPLDTAIGRNLCGIAWAIYGPAESTGEQLPWIHYLGMDQSPAVKWRRKALPSSKALMLVQGIPTMHAALADSGAQGLLPCFVGDEDTELRRIGDPVAMNRLWLLVHADLQRSARVRAVIDFLVPRLLADRARFEGTQPD